MYVFDHLKPKHKFLSPAEVIGSLDVKPEEIIIDFGSGSGFWTIPLAKKVGAKGLVIAIDNAAENLEIIKSKADRLGLSNTKYLKAPYSSSSIPAKEKADLILISNILSLVDSDSKLISSTKNNAKVGTKLVVIDWNNSSELGPKNKSRVNQEDVIIAANKAGFSFKKLIDAGTHHFGLYFIYEGNK